MTTKSNKGRYIYYRCSCGRGHCELPYMREEALASQLGDLLKNIYVAETIATQIFPLDPWVYKLTAIGFTGYVTARTWEKVTDTDN